MNESASSRTTALQGDAALLRAVGTFALTAAVINVIVGGGIFRMPSALATQMGAAAPLALVAGALAIIPIALCFAAVGSRVQVTGGPYSYLGATFGPFAGFVGGALMWISNFTSSAGVAAALSVQVANLVPAFAPPLPRALLLTFVYAALFALNAFGVKLGARAITTLAALKLTPLFLLAAIGVFFVDWSQVSFAIGDVPSWGALGASMVLVMFAYSGMETALVPSGEINDPARDVPRATMVAILLVVLLYLALQIVGQGLLGAGLAQSGVPVADTAGALWGPGRVLLLATACISMTGFLMGNLFGTARLVFALGRDGYLPRMFGTVSAAHRVPLWALAAHALLAWVLAIAGNFDALALISGGAICLVYGLVSLAAWRAQALDLRERGDAPFVLPGGFAIPLLAIAAMVAITATLTRKEWLAIGIALAALVATYALLRLRKRAA
ncbi:APC family permease [Lysobacter solisilvae (ex Woo and Kim 2020)]|uniref:Amino acid permease n=1 Tax=Agrilutibacter terrestris TaxID=2865112 RepID=A0A7H0FTR5_9GAMM|nr:APC family permease [Lysobacter terrestris]QNP39431.1 amino acid permease [Lysobacter terrestris]